MQLLLNFENIPIFISYVYKFIYRKTKFRINSGNNGHRQRGEGGRAEIPFPPSITIQTPDKLFNEKQVKKNRTLLLVFHEKIGSVLEKLT